MGHLHSLCAPCPARPVGRWVPSLQRSRGGHHAFSSTHPLPSDCPAAHDLTMMIQTSPAWRRLQAGRDQQPSLRSPGGRSGEEASPHQPPPLSVRADQRSACCAARSGAQDIGSLLVPHSGWCSEELGASSVQGGWVNESHHHDFFIHHQILPDLDQHLDPKYAGLL